MNEVIEHSFLGKGKAASSHKYTKRKWVNNSWRYWYDTFELSPKKKDSKETKKTEQKTTKKVSAADRLGLTARKSLIEAKSRQAEQNKKTETAKLRRDAERTGQNEARKTLTKQVVDTDNAIKNKAMSFIDTDDYDSYTRRVNQLESLVRGEEPENMDTYLSDKERYAETSKKAQAVFKEISELKEQRSKNQELIRNLRVNELESAHKYQVALGEQIVANTAVEVAQLAYDQTTLGKAEKAVKKLFRR